MTLRPASQEPPPSGSARHRYRVFGLSLASEIELPELRRDTHPAPQADVVIQLGDVPASLEGAAAVEPGVTATPHAVRLDFDEAAYLVEDGRRISVRPAPGAGDVDVRLYLLGSAMGAILHQRRMVPLHANAIDIGGRVVAFAGESGAGKSTLAAHFHRRGRTIFSDDVCVVSLDSAGRPLAWPGVPRIKLWQDALSALELPSDDLAPAWSGVAKFSVPTEAGAEASPLPLAAFYVLDRHEDDGAPSITRLQGAELAAELVGNVYRWPMAVAMGAAADEFRQLVALAETVPIFAFTRAWGHDRYYAQFKALEEHLASLPEVVASQ